MTTGIGPVNLRKALAEQLQRGPDPLLVIQDPELTGYAEIASLIPYKGYLYAQVAPRGYIYRLDPRDGSAKVLYDHPYKNASDWRMTCWGAYVTRNLKLIFAGWAADPNGDYRPYMFYTVDGETFTPVKLADYRGEAYCVYHLKTTAPAHDKVYAFVADLANDRTYVYRADETDLDTWTSVYDFATNHKIGNALEWFNHMWAFGTHEEPGMPSDSGVAIDYDIGTDTWAKHDLAKGMWAAAKTATPDQRIILGDADGWIYVTFSLPPSLDTKVVRLDAPVTRIIHLNTWTYGNIPVLIAATGLRWGSGSLYVIENTLNVKRVAQSAFGGIGAVAPYRSGLAYGTVWELAGHDYDPRSQQFGGEGSPISALYYVTPQEIAAIRAFPRDPHRRPVWRNEAKGTGEYSDIVPGIGWETIIFNVVANAAGNFIIEEDYGLDPSSPQWAEVQSEALLADTPKAIVLDIKGTRFRVKYDVAATLTVIAHLR